MFSTLGREERKYLEPTKRLWFHQQPVKKRKDLN